ncbi:MAG TPA: hypothetical protein P5335_09230 [Flavobacterium sp.]|nr:hypothetical protein [Flavobacterium sp.]HRZ75100.1 hypothetical protein [Flavobacterium sp.]
MFQYCHECINEYINAPSWITPIAQSITALVAIFALSVAWKNLRGLKRTQSLQAQMNLISLENEVRKNYLMLKIANQKYSEETQISNSKNILMLSIEKTNAFELYVSTADKLAALIASEFLTGQFEKRNWKDEYLAIFKKVKEYHQGEDSIIPGKDQMINNINKLLIEWSKS